MVGNTQDMVISGMSREYFGISYMVIGVSYSVYTQYSRKYHQCDTRIGESWEFDLDITPFVCVQLEFFGEDILMSKLLKSLETFH